MKNNSLITGITLKNNCERIAKCENYDFPAYFKQYTAVFFPRKYLLANYVKV